MITRISITGPESTGKTKLAEQIAAHYGTVYVPDYSRTYIEKLDRKYNHTDVLQIAKGIIEQENQMIHYSHRIFFSDNDLINIKIWLQYYKWHVPDWLEADIIKRKSDLYLLCDIDLAWIADEQRANPDDRHILFERFKTELEHVEARYSIIHGKENKRFEMAMNCVDEFLQNP